MSQMNLYLLCKRMGIRPDHVFEVGVNEPELSQIQGFLRTHWYAKATLVEPMPGCAERLRRAYGVLPDVTILEAAVTESPGRIALYDQGQSSYVETIPMSPALAGGYKPNEKERFTVEAVTFDMIDPGNIDVLAVDTEGSEWWVFAKMKSRPKIIVCETHLAFQKYVNPYLDNINRWMEENGYSVLFQTIADTVWIQ